MKLKELKKKTNSFLCSKDMLNQQQNGTKTEEKYAKV